MLRNIIRFLGVVVILLLVRQLIALVVRVFAGPREEAERAGPRPTQSPATQSGGALKRDPVCGTYVAVASSVKKTVAGETLHFCSIDCRDKHQVA